MTRCPGIARALPVLVVIGCAGPAAAHPYWLTLTDYAPKPGQVVEIGACSGVGFRGEARPWAPERCVAFSWITFRGFSLSAQAMEGDTVWARPSYFDRAGTWVEYESNDASIEIPAAEFDAYLAEEGLEGPLAVRRRQAVPTAGRERYRRCAKAWLAGDDRRRAVRPVGQPLEIVPLAVPGESPTLRVRVLWRGRALAGATVTTWCQPLAADARPRWAAGRDSAAVVERVRTDARGEASLGVGRPGEWLASAVHMVACADTAAADWESTWASLTFARREDIVRDKR